MPGVAAARHQTAPHWPKRTTRLRGDNFHSRGLSRLHFSDLVALQRTAGNSAVTDALQRTDVHIQRCGPGGCTSGSSCSSQDEDQAPNTQHALFAPGTAKSVGNTLKVYRQAEEELPEKTDEVPASSVCGFEVKGATEEGREEEEAEPVARAAESGLVTVADVGKVRPGDATVLCDGGGGFEVDLGMYKNFPCGVPNCVEKHENSHVQDIQKDVPEACKNKKKGDTPDVLVRNPDEWKKATECKAHTIELGCLKTTKGEPGCKPVLDKVRAKTRNAQKEYCG